MARYPWPPLPVLDRDEAARLMGSAMDQAWGDLEAERLRVISSKTLRRKREVDKALAEFQSAIETFGADVAYHLDRFAELHLGPTYLEGVRSAGGNPAWTAVNSQAFVSLATDTYDDFLARSAAAGRTSEAFARAVREASRRELPTAVAGGRTAKQAARSLEQRLADDYGLTTVTYANNARVPVRAYAEMVAQTKSGVAYNTGTVNESIARGVTYMEVFDGLGCGWSGHGDPDTASGSIRTTEECLGNPLSHPHCRRSFGPRPDVKTKAEAKKADPSTTADQRALTGTQTPKDLAAVRKREAARQRAQVRRDARKEATTPPKPAPEPVDPVEPAPVDRQALLDRAAADKVKREAEFQRILEESKAKAAADAAEQAARKAEAEELARIRKGGLDALIADFERRTAESIGKGTVSDALRARFPAIKGEEIAQEVIAVTNPMYATGHAYQVNCQNTTAAVEMRFRGLDVMGRARTEETGRTMREIAEEWRRVGPIETGERPRWDAVVGREKLAQAEADIPDGARGFLTVEWPQGGSHIFNWRKHLGRMEYIDGQTNDVYDLDIMVRNHRFKNDTVHFLRVDDADVVSDSLMSKRLTRRKTRSEVIEIRRANRAKRAGG